jgi:hypothetical protein
MDDVAWVAVIATSGWPRCGRGLVAVAVLAACNAPDAEMAAATSSSGTTTLTSVASDATSSGPPDAIPCNVDRDCEERCWEGRCVEGCSEEQPCSSTTVCIDDVCVPDVPSPPSCAGSSALPIVAQLALEDTPSVVGIFPLEDGSGRIVLGTGPTQRLIDATLDGFEGLPGAPMADLDTSVGDVDGDGHLDLLAEGGHSILLGDGGGAFVAIDGPAAAYTNAAVGDLDGDGRGELIAWVTVCMALRGCGGDDLGVFRGPAGAWEAIYSGFVGFPGTRLRIAALVPDRLPFAVFENQRGDLQIFAGPVANFQAEGGALFVPEFGGSDHAVARAAADDRAELWRNSPRVGFTFLAGLRVESDSATSTERWAVPGTFERLAAGDLDGDGGDDLVLGGTSGLAVVGDDGCLRAWPELGALVDVAVGDLDGDARPEIVVATDGSLVVYRPD